LDASGLDSGRRQAGGDGARGIVVCSLAEAQAALQAAGDCGVAVVLLSPPYGAASLGIGWFKAMAELARAAFPQVDAAFVLDCGDRADHVQAAFRDGLRDVCFTGPAAIRRKLEDIAAQYGARLRRRRPAALDLPAGGDAVAACRAWLAPRSRAARKIPTD
jgi:hypothetical protein